MNTPSIQYVRPTALLYLVLPSSFGGCEERTLRAPLFDSKLDCEVLGTRGRSFGLCATTTFLTTGFTRYQEPPPLVVCVNEESHCSNVKPYTGGVCAKSTQKKLGWSFWFSFCSLYILLCSCTALWVYLLRALRAWLVLPNVRVSLSKKEDRH